MAISISDKRRVAIAYDGSEDNRKLFEWSMKNVIRPETDHLIVLSAIPHGEQSKLSSDTSGTSLPMLSTSPNSAANAIADGGNAATQTARQRLNAMGDFLRHLQISCEEHILWGDAKTLIPRFTQKHPVDLLIVGSRGLGTVKSVFLGSVSARCVHECPCPVLVVRNAVI